MDFAKINLEDNKELARIIVKEAVKENFKTREEFQKFRNQIIKKNRGKIFHNLYLIRAYEDLLKVGEIAENFAFLRLIQKRSVRTQSGVAPLTVLTKPYPCPGKCIYCPTDLRMPKSYLISQPAAQRAFRQSFNPYTQVLVRLKALTLTGHLVSKVDLRVIGGTFSAYPKAYQKWFLKRCLQALNEFPQQLKNWEENIEIKKINKKNVYGGVDEINNLRVRSLAKEKISFLKAVKENERAEVRCVGINVETRPDFVTKKEIKRLRELGVTKVELGVQTLSDEIYKIVKRGHKIKAVIEATYLLKNSGIKVGYHIMPNLPGADEKMDSNLCKDLFTNPAFKPDYLKIYPCVVLPRTELEILYKQGKYKPYSDAILLSILAENFKNIPYYCRVDRIARDIPSIELVSGFRCSNIRQLLEQKLKKEHYHPEEIRFREIRDQIVDFSEIKFVEREYEAQKGKEFFLSFEDEKKDKLLALLRLRFPDETFLPELKGAAIIREVHVYGKQLRIGEKGREQKQHIGWGRKLLEKAEKISKEAGYKKIAVISAIGTREYYKKNGYELEGTYMVKYL